MKEIQKYYPWAAFFAALGVLIVSMRLMGRLWICECNKVYFWVSDAWSSNNSQHLFDPYSFSHIEHGVFFFALIWFVAKRFSWQWRFAMVVSMESLWEIFENSPIIINRYRSTTAALGYTGDTVINSLGDVFAAAVGFFICERFGWKWAAVAVIIVECAMLLTIRDNLFLNILLLIVPIPAISDWQAAIQQ